MTQQFQHNSVKDYGAAGDNFTNDTDAITTAVKAGGIIVFPKGTYLVDGDIEVPSNTTLYSNNVAIIKLNDNRPATIFKTDPRGAANIIFDGLILDGNNLNNPEEHGGNEGIQLYNGRNYTVRNCHIKNTNLEGVHIHAKNSDIEDVLVTNNYFSGCSAIERHRAAVSVAPSADNETIRNVNITNNVINGKGNSNYGVIIEPNWYGEVENIIVTNNNIYNTRGGGICVIHGQHNYTLKYHDNIKNIVIANNIVHSTYNLNSCGIQISCGKHFVVTGNIVHDSNSACLNVGTVVGANISNNSFFKSRVGDENSIVTFHGAQYVNFHHNYLDGDNNVELGIIERQYKADGNNGANTPFNIDPENNNINNNDIHGVVTPITTIGENTKTHRNNGYVTENSGTATIINGHISVNVNHGLDVCPTDGDIMVTQTGSLGDASEYYISAYTQTYFTILVDGDPGQTIRFAWKAMVI